MAALPNDDVCRRTVQQLLEEPKLTPWEKDFIEDNEYNTLFTTKQRDVVRRLREKYECD